MTDSAGLRAPLAGILGHGAAWGDVDGDGRPDLFVGGFCDRADKEYIPASGPVRNVLLRNLGDGRFTPWPQPAVEVFARTSGAVFADLDNRGWLDLYVANNARQRGSALAGPQGAARQTRSQLLRNDGGRLTEVPRGGGAAPDDLYSVRNVGVMDFDGDGRLDLLVVEDCFGSGTPRTRLFHNLGTLRFADVTAAAGLPDGLYGLGLAVADVNDDGRPDFFVPHSNRLFLSDGGGRYREAAELRAVFAHEPRHAEDWPCGAAWGDLNRNGLLDLVVTAHAVPARNRVFMNLGLRGGVPQFREITREAGLGDAVPVKCPHVEIQDFDNDGWPDIYTTAAWLDGGVVTPLIYRNEGVRGGIPRFQPPRPLGGKMVYFPTGPAADFDGDGRLDVFLVNWFAGNHCRLMRNVSDARHWLAVEVRGCARLNRMGIGAKVEVYLPGRIGQAAARLGMQEVSTGYGYAAGQPAVCHFGLGDVDRVDVRVRLPDGRTIDAPGVASRQRVTIEEPAGS